MTARPKFRRPPAWIEAVEARLMCAAFAVTSTADSGTGSLRAAILAANANDAPGAPVDDDITFNISPAGLHTINQLSALPQITGNVTIDATTQPGYTANYTPVVKLNGQGAGAGADGLRIASDEPDAASNVLGLIIVGFSGNGVVVSGRGNSVVQCYIGADESGAAAGPGNGGNGILVTADNNLIDGNVIAFNGGDGVAVANGAEGTTISPNTFFSNGRMAIDLGADGPTPNDAGDSDDGANRRQNYPVITSVTPAPTTGVTVTGNIDTTARTLVQVVLYWGPTNDGEGRNSLELQPRETDAAGRGTFTATLPSTTASDWITATATSYAFTGETSETNTSEFSSPVSASPTVGISAVFVRGSAWSAPDADPANRTFMEYLEAAGLGDDVYGFRVDGAGADAVLPWINLDQVVVKYSAVPTGSGVPTPDSLSFRGQKGDYPIASVTPVSGDPRAFVLTLTKYLGGGNPITGVAPTANENGDRVTLAVPGAGGSGAYSLRMNVLQGDVDHLNETVHNVLARDYAEVKKRFFKNTNTVPTNPDTDYSPFHDVDGNGQILARDYAEVKKRFFQTLPALTATQPGEPITGITRDLFGTSPLI